MSKGASPKARKHIPQRTCVVCRQTDSKRTLTRLVRTVDAGVQVDPSGKRSGRGAYLCGERSCLQRAIDGDVLAKALRTELTDDDRQRLRETFSKVLDMNPGIRNV